MVASARVSEARQRQHESEGVLGDGDRIAAGRVHDHDAALGGGIEIDVIDAHARASDDAQLGRLVHHGGVDEGGRAHQNGVGIGQFAGKRFFVGRDDGPVAVLGKDLERGGRDFVSNYDFHTLSRLGKLPGEGFLHGAHAGAEFEVVGWRDLQQYVLQRADDADGIEVVVVAEMGDAEELALHLALAVGDDHGKALAEFLHDGAGIDAGGRQHRGHRSGRTGGREQLQAERLHAGAHHGGRSFRIVDERIAAVGQIAVAGAANVIQRRRQPADQRDRRSKRRLALGLRLALLAQVEVKARLLGCLPCAARRARSR